MDLAKLAQFETDALSSLAAASSPESLEAWRVEFLGSSGKVKGLMGALKDVPKEQKPQFGAKVNAVKGTLEAAFADKKATLGTAAPAGTSGVDVTEPGIVNTRSLGRAHILSRVIEELSDVFARMGFEVAQGPELEDDAHNFVLLNIPPGHPARDPADNFYVDDPRTHATARMLRSQTSTVQARVMQQRVKEGGGKLAAPIKIIAPGRVYRPDTVDATHSFMFHQLEGLFVDHGVTMADLKTTLLQFARAYFGPDAEIRLRPSFFPFTEPSTELDMKIRLRPDQPARWIELGGCGMVDPAVLTACGIDPEEWTGFAFGFGIERIAMGRYQIPDIRLLFENDLRFLERV
ncbi:MAG TPA: phenylalanine--tRNA ligase subunit alpha [Phycisphaerales bacterium]|nr:phenylalanine--tRNA ligase subunit alpha [Phycisphaerales bacterium]